MSAVRRRALLCLASFLVSVGRSEALRRLPRRGVLAVPWLSSPRSTLAAGAGVRSAPVSFSSASLSLDGLSIPVAVWAPASAGRLVGEAAATYPYTISIGRIAARLGVHWLAWLPSKSFALPPAGVTGRANENHLLSAREGDALIFAHGFLGSPYDMAHVCEALAACGFIVAAPEMPESLAASYAGGVTREQIVKATQQLVDGAVRLASPGGKRRWGIFGHSAGGGTAFRQPGEFVLGRAGIAAGLAGMDTMDPLFIIASEADGCNRFMRARGITLVEQIEAAAAAGRPTTVFSTPSAAYASESPARGALLFGAGSSGEPDLSPNHISFLWSGTNEAMFDLLTPFLPLARALDLFLLDFDVEMDQRLSEPTAAQVLPALCRFFGNNAIRAPML